ncbi:uncharacterized protein LOC144458933 isoform X2 [Epinephelus lanceolatus]
MDTKPATVLKWPQFGVLLFSEMNGLFMKTGFLNASLRVLKMFTIGDTKDLKNPKTGSGTDGGESTWKYFQEMHEVLGGRPSIDPPLVVASFTAEGDPTAILEEIVGGPSTATTTAADGLSTSDAGPPTTTSASPPTPSPKKKKKKNNPVVDFLKNESEREQKRNKESEAKTERFLCLFEKMVDKM